MPTLLTEAKHGEIYTGYDAQIASVCMPNFQIIRTCLQATLTNGDIFLKVELLSAMIDTHIVIKSETFEMAGQDNFKVQSGLTGVLVNVLEVVVFDDGFFIDLKVMNYLLAPGKGYDGPTHHYSLRLNKLKATEEMSDTEITYLLARHLLSDASN